MKKKKYGILVINKPAGTRIDNGIGEFFGEHNLMEYKSPTDHGYNEMAVCQALAYAFITVIISSANETVFEKMKEDETSVMNKILAGISNEWQVGAFVP